MCDERTARDDEALQGDRNSLSRRAFGAASMAALAACAASPADARAVAEQDVSITTPDGVCDAHFAHPAGGAHAAVLVWPDIMGLRPAFRMMGKRLAESGYAVLTVNPFYRQMRAPIMQEGESFSNPETRQRLMGIMRALTPQTHGADAAAFIDWLDAQGAVDKSRMIGTTGYCMGGAIAFRTAAARPARVGAVGSFHGGGLASANPDSPHLLIPETNASYLIAIARNDDEADPAAKDTLRTAFAAAGRPAEIEVYPANHGWCSLDHQAYDQAEADRAWARLLDLFSTALA